MSRLRDLPDLARFEYRIVRQPTAAGVKAWAGLLECERRLYFCKWIREGVAEDTGSNYRLLVQDFSSAFILSFEAVIQSLKKQWNEDDNGFWTWLRNHESHSLAVKGLRAIRHLSAHFEIQEGTGKTVVPIGPDGGERQRHYWLPEITEQKLETLTTRPLKVTDLDAWKVRYSEMEVDEVFEQALQDLTDLVSDAEEDPRFLTPSVGEGLTV